MLDTVTAVMLPSKRRCLARRKRIKWIPPRDVVWLTPKGQDMAGEPPEMENNQQAQEAILNDLTPKMQAVFKMLQDGQPRLRSEIAVSLKYASEQEQGFKKLLARIREKGYLEFVDKESVQLPDICFPCGRDK